MSMGYGAIAKIEMRDETTTLYKYQSYNLNIETSKKCMDFCDGEIWINNEVFVKGEIYFKKARKSNGKKVLVERIRKKEVDILKMISENKIELTNASGAWRFDDKGNDVMIYRIIYMIFDKYQELGEAPEEVFIYT